MEVASPDGLDEGVAIERESAGMRVDLASELPFQIANDDGVGDAGDESDIAVSQQALVFGTDTRVRSSASHYPQRAIVALRRTSDAVNAYCSGFKITPRHILTAAHCLYRQGAWTTTPRDLRVVLFQNGTGTGTKLQARRFWVPSQWLVSTPDATTSPAWDHDYALLTLDDVDSTPGWFDFVAQRDVAAGVSRWLSGYPSANDPCADGVGGRCAGWLYEASAKIDAVYGDLIVTRTDVTRGQSGGPLYYLPSGSTQRRAIGLVSHGHMPRDSKDFVLGIHGNAVVRITSAIESALCKRINNERPSKVTQHPCYR